MFSYHSTFSSVFSSWKNNYQLLKILIINFVFWSHIRYLATWYVLLLEKKPMGILFIKKKDVLPLVHLKKIWYIILGGANYICLVMSKFVNIMILAVQMQWLAKRKWKVPSEVPTHINYKCVWYMLSMLMLVCKIYVFSHNTAGLLDGNILLMSLKFSEISTLTRSVGWSSLVYTWSSSQFLYLGLFWPQYITILVSHQVRISLISLSDIGFLFCLGIELVQAS